MDLNLQATICEVAGLPSLPPDPRAAEVAANGDPPRHVSWVVCCQGPGFHYKQHYIDVTPEWIDERIEAYAGNAESKPGWIAPVQVGHTDTGKRQGDFFDVRNELVGTVCARSAEHPDGLDWSRPVPTMLAAVAWVDPDAEEKIRTFQLTHISFGIRAGIQRQDTGEVLRGVQAYLSTDGFGTVARRPSPRCVPQCV